MLPIQATPFVPGRTRGKIHYGGGGWAEDAIVVLSYRELKPLEPPPGGLILADAAPLSHAAIGLLALGVPAVLVTSEQTSGLSEGMHVDLDGSTGVISAAQGSGRIDYTGPKPPRPGAPVTTADHHAVELRASIADACGASKALACGATAIGLVRSEFLVSEAGGRPTVDFYESAFRALFEAAHPLAITVRLIDLAPDKRALWLPRLPGMEGALGLQGARLYDVEPVRTVVRSEIQALGRLAEDVDLRLLLPYVVRTEEFIRWRHAIEGSMGAVVPLGAMLEAPAAALEIAHWLQLADFVSVGCNDLMQCLFAADRDLPEVAELLDPYAPVLFRVLGQMAEAAGERVGRVQLCGLLSQVPGVLPVLLGLGYRIFSTAPIMIPYLARIVAEVDTRAAARLAFAVCAAADGRRVRELLGVAPGGPWGGVPGGR